MIKPGHFKDSRNGVLRKILTGVLFLQQIFRNKSARFNVTSDYNAQIQDAPKLNFRKKPLIFSLALFIAIVFTGYAVYDGDKKLTKSEQAERKAAQVIQQAANMLSLTREIEMALQLFGITNNRSFIKPLYTGEKSSRLYLDQLQKLTKDNAAQQRRVDSLSFYMHGLLASAFQITEVKRVNALDSMTNFSSKGNSKSAINQVRNITNAIQLEENTFLKQKREIDMESRSAFKRLSAFLVLLIVLLTILLFVTGFPYLLQLTYANHIKQLSFQLEKKLADYSANMGKYQYFFYNTLDLACFANTEGYFEELNGNFLKVLGYTKKQLLEKKFSEYIHPDDIRSTLKMVSRLYSGVNVVNFTNRYKTNLNTYKDLEWNATFNPETKKVYAIARDVTGQMAAKREVAFQNEEKEKRAAELSIANKKLGFQSKEQEKCAAELIVANKELAFNNKEKEKRAAELTIANKELGFNYKDKEKRAAELIIANKELAFQNEEKEKRAAELTIANKELGFQNKEKEKRAAELIVANKELAFQNKEKEKRAAELTIANKELGFNYKDKEKRAAELIIANKELAFQNEEKEKRAAELTIANKELGFQNKEKEKRAAELIVANKELAFQNKEKEKRAAELTIANKELGFNNKDKEKRAAELIIANKELAFQNEEIEKLATELTVANKEMAVQNQEKEKSAAELIIANKELVFQHKEKEKRAEELAIANMELVFQNEEKEKRAIELVVANKELKKAEDDIRKLNEELEQKVNIRTRELELANKELESFSYSVSHDLRAPLRAVHGYATMLHEDYGSQLDTEAGRLMGNVISNSKKMGQLIDDLLAFSRLGRKELVKMNIPMYEIATNVCNEIKSEQVNRIIHFDIDELHPAEGDVVTIKQVWVNLISNAVKYSKLNKNALIEIRSELKVNEVIYSIKDNGAGFDMRYANKLFSVFQRLHNEETFEGTGVGLAIVHRIISKHGGRVWAEAKVGLGAKFYFSLPKAIEL